MKTTIKYILVIALLLIFPLLMLKLESCLYPYSSNEPFTGDILTYVGTAFLGFLAFYQNDKLHKLEQTNKKSKILFYGTVEYSEHKLESGFVQHSENFACNYHLFSDNNDFKGEKFIHLVFPIDSTGFDLNEIIINKAVINENEPTEICLYKNKLVETELVYSVKNDGYQIELVFICAQLNTIKNLINENNFILTLNYDLISSANVKSTYNTKLNFESIKLDSTTSKWYNLDNISYMEKYNG